ncbi:NACHT domain-containing protein [Streptomyces sp. T-3]|nr:NACHT domain-containing protein [Streptomyces sp. T-3]
MQGLEVALAKLAGTVVSAVARSLLAPRPGAGLVRDPVRRAPRARRSANVDTGRLAKALAGRLDRSYAGLPEHERLAAVAAVGDAFAAAGPIGVSRVFAVDLDPERLRGELRSADVGLSERGRALYEELLLLCCSHAVEQVTADPSFAGRVAVEQVRVSGRTRELVEELGAREPRVEAVALGFEQRYADYVAQAHGRLELFGVTLGGRGRAEWSLDTAYISLGVSSENDSAGPESGLELPPTMPPMARAEEGLAGSKRLLLRGGAGSGKSTLVQWLALNAARRSFGPELADWNRCVPFVLQLRSFTASAGLPMPEDFLRSAGVPLHGAAPAGWTEELLASGRALVLVDGVDEVPMRLRSRTEKWLRSLVTAFPQARYVVTTRPAAVPDDWMSGDGFMAHSLLPMEREDIRDFIRHWHDAARQECEAARERGLLDTYEAALSQAVATRQDLARLATNPLMCALLCALNRDRRMQLPRARKELYDAALDMLLVRRDTEREITDVEGISLTREEQMALLQRLAYWLIRNGQLLVSRTEAIEMIDEWLDAMPQVREQGNAEKVFSHLLIRSGLLREPVPGAVHFVHRTFQDYLGAKAAVEARDFGVLVRNAHDDSWDDVVRMAVGHARVEERSRLLRQLLKRADKVQRYRQRLVLLAAASLEHAPELDPGVRGEVEARTKELLPPHSLEEAKQLADVGELVLELLPGPDDLDELTAEAVVKTAGLVGGDAGLAVISRYRQDARRRVARQVSWAWGEFDAEPYAQDVLAAGKWTAAYLHVRTAQQLRALRFTPRAKWVQVSGDHTDLGPLRPLRQLDVLALEGNAVLTDLGPLAALAPLRAVSLLGCSALRDLSPLVTTGVEQLGLAALDPELSLAPLSDARSLRHVDLNYTVPVRSVGELPFGPDLSHLALYSDTEHIALEGIERWTQLRQLSVSGPLQTSQLGLVPRTTSLSFLRIQYAATDLDRLADLMRGLEELVLWRCELPHGLVPLRELPALGSVWIAECTRAGEPIDLSPLADLDHVTVTLSGETPVLGEDLLPAHRLIRR